MRTKFFYANIKAGVLKQVLTEILRFIVRTVFIQTLSAEYLGINGLFTNILTMLSVTELGINSAITYALYKPLAEKNINEIRSLVSLLKKAYRIIGLTILILGLLLMPFLEYIVNGAPEIINIYLVFLLFLLNMVSSYMFFGFKSILLNADQKRYIVDNYSSYAQILLCSLQIIVLVTLKNMPEVAFYLYNISQVTTTVSLNLIVSRKVTKLYPYTQDKSIYKISPEVKDGIVKNIKGLFLAKIAGGILRSIDSIVISTFIAGGTALFGIYSNYLVIVASVEAFLRIISNSLVAGLGNLYATESIAKNKKIFNGIELFYSWAYGFCGICFFVLLNPFIENIWLNSDYVLSEMLVFLIMINFVIAGSILAIYGYLNAAGLHFQARIRYIISVVLNVTLSIGFVTVINWGIEGVVFATTISTLGMNLVSPYIVFKYAFKESSKQYYVRYLSMLILIISTALLTKYISHLLFPTFSIANFIGMMAVCVIIPNLLWFLIFRKTQGFVFIKERIFLILKKKKSI